MNWEFTGLKLLVSGVFGFIVSFLGGTDKVLELLIFLIIIDFVTGFIKGIHEKKVSADKMFDGGLKKIVILIIVAVAYQLEKGLGTSFNLREITIIYYILQELISIIQNANVFTSVPDELTDFINYFQKKENDK